MHRPYSTYRIPPNEGFIKKSMCNPMGVKSENNSFNKLLMESLGGKNLISSTWNTNIQYYKLLTATVSAQNLEEFEE